MLTNSSTKDITAFSVSLRYIAADGKIQQGQYDAENSPNGIAVPAGGTVTEHIGAPGPGSTVLPTVTAVVFSDDTAAGDPIAINNIFARRRAWVAGTQAAMEVLKRDVNKSTGEAITDLQTLEKTLPHDEAHGVRSVWEAMKGDHSTPAKKVAEKQTDLTALKAHSIAKGTNK